MLAAVGQGMVNRRGMAATLMGSLAKANINIKAIAQASVACGWVNACEGKCGWVDVCEGKCGWADIWCFELSLYSRLVA